MRPETMGDRVGRGLRTRGPGCSSPALFSAADAPSATTASASVPAPLAHRRHGQSGTRRPLRPGKAPSVWPITTGAVARCPGRPGVTLPDDCGGSNASNIGFGCAGAHLRPEFRQDREATLNQGLGADRRDPTAPRLPRAGQSDD